MIEERFKEFCIRKPNLIGSMAQNRENFVNRTINASINDIIKLTFSKLFNNKEKKILIKLFKDRKEQYKIDNSNHVVKQRLENLERRLIEFFELIE